MFGIGQVLCVEDDVFEITEDADFHIEFEFESIKDACLKFNEIRTFFCGFRKHLPRQKCVTILFVDVSYSYVCSRILLKKAVCDSLGVLEYEEESCFLIEEFMKEEENENFE